MMRMLSIVVMAGLFGGCDGDEAASVPVESSVEIGLEPVTTFVLYCERCHGPGGSQYARPFVTQEDELRAKIEEMMRGPAGLNPTTGDIDAMLEYHLTMRGEQ